MHIIVGVYLIFFLYFYILLFLIVFIVNVKEIHTLVCFLNLNYLYIVSVLKCIVTLNIIAAILAN